MKLLLCGILVSALLPSIAMANFCRVGFESLADREECVRGLAKIGVATSGDWNYTMDRDESGNSFMKATNFPIPNGKASLDKKPSGRIQMYCIMNTFPILRIESIEPFTSKSNIRYKFDGGDYRSLSEDVTPTEIDGGDGVVRIYRRDLINKVLNGSIFQISAVGLDGEVIEHVYTLDGGLTVKSSLECLSDSE